MIEYRIIIAEYPISGSNKSKLRPVVMLNSNLNEFQQFQCAYITSNNDYKNYNDVLIEGTHPEFNFTKLSKSSIIRLSKIETFEPSQIKGILGEVPKSIKLKIKKILTKQFNLK
jgi:PemK-like, MazF-like toxin of type II toxin-antitoxin system